MKALSTQRKNNKSLSKLNLPLGSRSYDIHVGPGALTELEKWRPRSVSRRAFVIADTKLIDARAATLAALRKAGWNAIEFPVEAGENLKDWARLYPLYGELLSAGAKRDSTLIALGGGTVGDATGFVAATYMRGISWVGVPSTLLAQVDSAVGGKTGINHASAKNLIGAFHQPSLVLCDTHLLETLDRRDMVSGLGEVIKCALLSKGAFFAFIEKNIDLFFERDPEVLRYFIHESLKLKSKLVAKDEHDLRGVREILNLGHTFAHALETSTSYQSFRHGEAVIWGLRFAVKLSKIRKKLPAKTAAHLSAFLESIDIPELPEHFELGELLKHVKHDKKNRSGSTHYVLLKKLGLAMSDGNVLEKDLKQAFDNLQRERN